MKTHPLERVLLPGTAWALLLLIPITFFGFYPSYFSRLSTPTSTVVHVHSVFMLLWLATVVVQPLLIKFNKLNHPDWLAKSVMR